MTAAKLCVSLCHCNLLWLFVHVYQLGTVAGLDRRDGAEGLGQWLIADALEYLHLHADGLPHQTADSFMQTLERIIEVGPRDGLQNESELVPTDTKVAFVEALGTEMELRRVPSPPVQPKTI